MSPPEGEPEMVTVIGVDIGQKRERTAIAVVELEYRKTATAPPQGRDEQRHYLVRFLERLRLGTSYPEIARRLADICRRLAGLGSRPSVFVNATGIGAPVVEMLQKEAREARPLWAVHLNHGDRCAEEWSERRVTLGQAYMVSRLQVLLQSHQLHLPNSSEARVVVQELLAYEMRVLANANSLPGAFRIGTHDDLVTAMGLAVHKEPVISVYPMSGNELRYPDQPSGLSAMASSDIWGRRGLSSC